MDVGTGLITCQRRPDDPRSYVDLYEEMLTLGQVADDAGLASIWVSEHHFAEDGYLPGTMPSLGALAACTDRIDLGTCVALAPLYDPVRLVEDAATVDLISDGRMQLGLSIGYRNEEFEHFGIDRSERVERTVDAVELAKATWRDSSYDPTFHPIGADVPITPPPSDNGPPILLGGSAKPAVRRAATIADGWIAPSSLDANGLRIRADDIRRTREEAGLEEDFKLYVLKHGFIGDTPDEAWEAMRPGYFYLARSYASYATGEPVDRLSTERQTELQSAAIYGTPDAVANELIELAELLGEDIHVIFRTYYPGIGTDQMQTCIERLGDEVLPVLP